MSCSNYNLTIVCVERMNECRIDASYCVCDLTSDLCDEYSMPCINQSIVYAISVTSFPLLLKTSILKSKSKYSKYERYTYY